MNDVYWTCEAQRYSSLDRGLTVGTAVLSSSTLLALVSSMPSAGKWLAFAASVLSIVHATIFNRTRVKQASALASRYKEMAIEFKLLFSHVQSTTADDAKKWKEYEALCRREKQIDESGFTIDDKRMDKAQMQVFKARGL